MADLTFYYSAMNSGKSTNLIQKAYNYEECGLKVALLKPSKDTKIEDAIHTRVGLSRKVDLLVNDQDSIIQKLKRHLIKKGSVIDSLFVEEAQFLTESQINELVIISSYLDIEVICYGLRRDFLGNGFPGSDRLMIKAQKLIGMETKCKSCGDNAHCNARKANGVYVSAGEQVSIDGVDSTYDSLCELCYAKNVLGINPEEMKKDFQKSIQYKRNE